MTKLNTANTIKYNQIQPNIIRYEQYIGTHINRNKYH